MSGWLGSVLGTDAVPSVDRLQSLTFTLCHVYARATHTVSIPAPVYCDVCLSPRVSSLNRFTADASLVRNRAKYHYDPQLGLDFFASETEGDPTEALPALERFRQYFRPTHERMKKLMYFC